MNEQNYYSPPEAELGGESTSRGVLRGPTTLGDALGEILTFGGRHFVELFLGNFIVFGPALVWFLFLMGTVETLEAGGDATIFWMVMASSILIAPLSSIGYSALLQYCDILYKEEDRKLDFGKALRDTFSMLGYYLIFGVMYVLGLLLCVIPGLILLVIFMPGPTVIVAEDKGPIEALKRCWEMGWVHGHGWITFGILVVMYFVNLAFSMVSAVITVPLTMVMDLGPVMEMLVMMVPTGLYMPFAFATFYITYAALYARTEGYMNEALEEGSFGFGGRASGGRAPNGRTSGGGGAGGIAVVSESANAGAVEPIDISEYDGVAFGSTAGRSAYRDEWSKRERTGDTGGYQDEWSAREGTEMDESWGEGSIGLSEDDADGAGGDEDGGEEEDWKKSPW